VKEKLEKEISQETSKSSYIELHRDWDQTRHVLFLVV